MSTGGPAERRLRWFVAALDDPTGLTVRDLEAVYDNSDWRGWTFEQELEALHAGRHGASRPLTIERVSAAAAEATAVLAGSDGRSFTVTCWVESAEPHRITRVRLVPTPPEGLVIRLARPEDGPGLAALERRAPLRLGKEPLTLMTIDHGDDYFAPSRLMGEATIYVGEIDGRLVGVYCGAVQTVRLDGVLKRLYLEHHVRIDPDASRGAVFWALCNFGRDHYARAADSIAFYVSLENLALRKFVSDVPPWSVPPLRALLPCAADADAEPVGERVTADDADDVVEVLNDCHDRSALYLPSTAASFRSRLTRDPQQYRWDDLRSHGGAVVGVGRNLVRVTKERNGTVEETTRALALDHGFRPGRDAHYRALLQSRCRELAGRGATHLAVFTSERSPTYGVVTELAEQVEPFDFWAFDVPEPAELLEGGFYVDTVYF